MCRIYKYHTSSHGWLAFIVQWLAQWIQLYHITRKFDMWTNWFGLFGDRPTSKSSEGFIDSLQREQMEKSFGSVCCLLRVAEQSRAWTLGDPAIWNCAVGGGDALELIRRQRYVWHEHMSNTSLLLPRYLSVLLQWIPWMVQPNTTIRIHYLRLRTATCDIPSHHQIYLVVVSYTEQTNKPSATSLSGPNTRCAWWPTCIILIFHICFPFRNRELNWQVNITRICVLSPAIVCIAMRVSRVCVCVS